MAPPSGRDAVPHCRAPLPVRPPATRSGTGAQHCAAGSSAQHGELGGKCTGLRVNFPLPERHPLLLSIRRLLHRLNFPDHVFEEPPSKKYKWVPVPWGLGRSCSPPTQLYDTRAPLPGAVTKFRVFRVPEYLPHNAPSETFSGWTGAVPPRFSAPLRGAARTVRGAESPQSRQLRSAGSLPSTQLPPSTPRSVPGRARCPYLGFAPQEVAGEAEDDVRVQAQSADLQQPGASPRRG